MNQPSFLDTVPTALSKALYDIVICPDLEESGRMQPAAETGNVRVLEQTGQVYRDELRIPKAIGPVLSYEEWRIATGDNGGDNWTPMVSLGDRRMLDPARETYQVVDAHVSIRILELKPARALIEDLECELRVVRLKDEPVYEALSYTWGDESHRRFILVNGQRFSITYNLWAALRYLRHPTRSRFLWTDAICINQNDVKEKNYMVSQMHVIYHNSTQVIAWLGDPTLKSEQAFRYLNKYMREGPQMGPNQEGWQAVVEKSPPMRNVDLSTWDALLDIFGRPWWSRAWIAQEVTCARAGWTLMCGASTLSGNHLSCVLPHFFDALEDSEVPPEAKQVLDSGPFAVLSMAFSTPNQLGDVLEKNRRRKAKEDKDKVYACVNMIAPAIDELKPDYKKSTAEIYYDTAIQLIVKGDNLALLAVCENHDEQELEKLSKIDGVPRNYIKGLPTWVPNWALPRITEELWGGYTMKGFNHPFSASGTKRREVKFHGDSLASSKGLLTIRGRKIATVEQLGHDSYNESVSDAVQDAFRLVANAPIVVPAGQNGGDGVLRSLTLDRDAEGQQTYDDIAKQPHEIRRSMHRAMIGRRFFRTREGFVGLGPRRLKVNDQVVLIPGCHVPIILRATVYVTERYRAKCGAHKDVKLCLGRGCDKDGILVATRFDVIGETYLHGVMNGELSSVLENGLQDFILSGIEEKFIVKL